MRLTTDTLKLIEKKICYDPREMMSRDKNAPRMVQPVNNLHEAFHVQIPECHIESALFTVDDLTASVVCIG